MLDMYLFIRFPKFLFTLIAVLIAIPTLSSCGLIGSADAGPAVDATLAIDINVVSDQYWNEFARIESRQVTYTANKHASMLLRVKARTTSGKCFYYKVAVKQLESGTAKTRDVQYLAGSRKASSMCEYYPKEADFIVRLTPGEYQVLFNGKDYDVDIRVV